MRAAIETLRLRVFFEEIDGQKSLTLAAQLDRLGCRVPELEVQLGGELPGEGETKTWFTERATKRKIPSISGRRLRKF